MNWNTEYPTNTPDIENKSVLYKEQQDEKNYLTVLILKVRKAIREGEMSRELGTDLEEALMKQNRFANVLIDNEF